jgi:dimeric dUTPase (all-alpha-NTP-PPase superfamily)
LDFKQLWEKHLDYFRTDLIPKSRAFFMGPEVFKGYRIFMISSAIIHECVELQRETNFKWWKKPKELDLEKIDEEIIDIWHFIIQLSIEREMDPDKMIAIYEKKLEENIKRAQTGY